MTKRVAVEGKAKFCITLDEYWLFDSFFHKGKPTSKEASSGFLIGFKYKKHGFKELFVGGSWVGHALGEYL